MKSIISFFTCLLFIGSATIFASVSETHNSNSLIKLTEWKYLIPMNKNDFRNAEEALASDHWESISSPKKIEQEYKGRFIWMKTKLHDWQGIDPAVYLEQSIDSIYVFLDSELIYHPGNLTPVNSKYYRWNQCLIRLPYYKKGTYLSIRIKAENILNVINENAEFGSSLEIVRNIFKQDIINFVILSIILMSGIVALFAYFNLNRTKLLLGLILFLISIGFFIASNTPIFQLIFNNPSLFYRINYVSTGLGGISFFYLIEQVVADNYKRIINIIWKIKLVILLFTLIILEQTSLKFFYLFKNLMVINVLFIVIGLAALFLTIKKHKSNNKALIIAGAGVFLSLIIEFMIILLEGVNSDFKSYASVFFGMILFVATIMWAAFQKYRETNREKETMRQNEFESIKRENEATEIFASKLIESQENERNRIALELHDSVGQKLLLVKNRILSRIKNSGNDTNVKSLEDVSELTSETIQEIRNIIYNLRPEHLDHLGLKTAIETLVENLSNNSAIIFDVNIDEIDELFIKTEEINFFRIVQESLNNIIKHSGATKAFIDIKVTGDVLLMVIKDNGDIQKPQTGSVYNGIGLAGMRERAKMIGAELNIDIHGQDGNVVSLKYHLKNK